MKSYRSAMGKTVDMNALASRNETVRAVGNMSVNARGDTIDQHGKIVKSSTTKVNESYTKTVGNRSAQVRKSNITPDPLQKSAEGQPKIESFELTELEKELEASIEDDLEVEKIKKEEVKTATKKGKK